MQERKVKSNWDKEANFGLKENTRGNYLSGLFIKAIDIGIGYLPREKEKISLLKTDLWNEGADFKKNVLGNYANEKFNLFGIDLSTEVIKALKVGAVKPVQANISALPFKVSSMDILLDLSTIDHLPFSATENVINQYRRALKPEGILILVFDSWGLFWKLYFIFF